MQAGIYFGYVDLVNGLLVRVRAEIGTPVPVVATGGWAKRLAPHCDQIDTVDPLLTLDGLKIISGRYSS
jgi:type III pantothenate kinase